MWRDGHPNPLRISQKESYISFVWHIASLKELTGDLAFCVLLQLQQSME